MRRSDRGMLIKKKKMSAETLAILLDNFTLTQEVDRVWKR